MARRVTGLLTALALVVLGPAAPASASCMLDERPLDERLAEHPLVFVGTVVDVRNDGRSAAFAVDEVWRGQAGREAIVHGGPPDAEFATSVDRFFAVGTRYLVAARIEDGAWLSDSCMPTEEWDEQRHAAVRPAGAAAPTGDVEGPDRREDTDPGSGALPWALLALAVGGIGAVALARRRIRDRSA